MIRIRKKHILWLAVPAVALVTYGSYRFDQVIFNPRELAVDRVELSDLMSDRWYVSDKSLEMGKSVERLADSRAVRFAYGMYYKLYRTRYSAGVRNTQYVKIGPNQYPDIYEMVVNACNVLSSRDSSRIEVPQVYAGNLGGREITVTNYRNPCILISNDFLWAFTPEELQFLLARCVGHIHCRDVFLLDAVRGTRFVLDSAMPEVMARALLGGAAVDLVAWLNEAEMTADRAGLLVVGDVDVAANALIKLNLTASVDQYYGPANVEAFAAQVAALEGNRISTVSAALAELRNPNPFLTMRARNLLAFYDANAYLFKDRAVEMTRRHRTDRQEANDRDGRNPVSVGGGR